MEEVVKYDSKPLTVKDIKGQVDLIQDVMRSVMKKDEHYGLIPGCGDKPALLKPGAEKLNLTFRMAPDPETQIIDMGGGHREYRVKCIMRSIETGCLLGAGVGSASTMETKWRYRNAEPEITERVVPGKYWDLRKNDAAAALDLIGGKGFTTKKVGGSWFVAKLTGEKVEYDNPADYYNTCWKMAKKRSLVDAVLTVLGASDIFTQDVDEMVEDGTIPGKKEPPKEAKETKPPEQSPQSADPTPQPEGPEDNPQQSYKIKTVSHKPGKAYHDIETTDGKKGWSSDPTTVNNAKHACENNMEVYILTNSKNRIEEIKPV